MFLRGLRRRFAAWTQRCPHKKVMQAEGVPVRAPASEGSPAEGEVPETVGMWEVQPEEESAVVQAYSGSDPDEISEAVVQ